MAANAMSDYIANTLYQGVLGRTADAEGLAFWTQKAANEGLTQDQLTQQWTQNAAQTLSNSSAAKQKELAPALVQATQPAYVQNSNVFQSAPAYQTYTPKEFKFEEDPGVAYRKEQANKAMQAQQLASGNFFSGGALEEAATLNSNLASQEYGNAFNRYLGKENIDFRATNTNNTAGFDQWQRLDNTAYDRNWNEGQQDYNRWVDQYNRNTTADNTNWDRLKYLDSAGLNAATQTGNFGQNAAGNSANLTNYAGSAQAGGYINSANSWTNALGNAIYELRK